MKLRKIGRKSKGTTASSCDPNAVCVLVGCAATASPISRKKSPKWPFVLVCLPLVKSLGTTPPRQSRGRTHADSRLHRVTACPLPQIHLVALSDLSSSFALPGGPRR